MWLVYLSPNILNEDHWYRKASISTFFLSFPSECESLMDSFLCQTFVITTGVQYNTALKLFWFIEDPGEVIFNDCV